MLNNLYIKSFYIYAGKNLYIEGGFISGEFIRAGSFGPYLPEVLG